MTGSNRLQVVLGGTSGMGLATARALGAYGPVLVGGRNPQRLEGALDVLGKAGVEAHGKTCDVSDPASLAEFCEHAASIAPIGNVVNAAGVDFDQASSEKIALINMQGTHYAVEAFLPYLDNSCLVLFSSITGYFYQAKPEDFELWADPAQDGFCQKAIALVPPAEDPRVARLGAEYGVYSCSKRFVMYYAMANAARVAQRNGSRIFSIAPGSFMTPMLEGQADYLDQIAQGTALKRIGQPDEMASLIAALLGPGHDYLTGCDIVMDGGKLAVGTVKQMGM